MLDKALAVDCSEIVRHLLSFAHTHGVPYETLVDRESICSDISSINNVAVSIELLAVEPDIIGIDLGHPDTPRSQAVSGGGNVPRYSADRTSLV